jgi:hypothetical protein
VREGWGRGLEKVLLSFAAKFGGDDRATSTSWTEKKEKIKER